MIFSDRRRNPCIPPAARGAITSHTMPKKSARARYLLRSHHYELEVNFLGCLQQARLSWAKLGLCNECVVQSIAGKMQEPQNATWSVCEGRYSKWGGVRHMEIIIPKIMGLRSRLLASERDNPGETEVCTRYQPSTKGTESTLP